MRLSADQIGAKKQKTGQAFGTQAETRLCGNRLKKQRGFTMVELITVIVIAGVLAAAATPRFFDRNAFESRGFYDQVISTLRYAQKTAVAQHRFVCVEFTTSRSITLTFDATPPSAVYTVAACPGSDLVSPGGQASYVITSPNADVTFVSPAAGTTFNFSALGRPSASPGPISVSGYTTSNITVEAETGYVHSN